ncbi:DUF551 domain-containing protein [Enterobacter hormaechei]|uniref:DUF551 domain-containing protein n=1 Tax=Enterobacter hormaechei TaxID=158836 RepID=UPI0007924461|nr:DUF551 domain-containing protein [Enterobacter hormaechei]CZZ71780.1 Protein of uncharacterised function (DUF551) [Enterobacter hormaechei]
MNIEVMKLVRDNIKMGSVLSFTEVMIIQQAMDAAMLQCADGNSPAHFRSRPAQSSLSPAQGGNSPVIPDGWVACSERMPEGMTDVHISNGHDVGQGWWDGETWQTQHDYYSVPGDVTHWMPLPAAPQQEVK